MRDALERAKEEQKPDMTPMIDCVFLMIVFFVCVDFRVLEAKLPAHLPKDRGSGPTRVEPQEQLAIAIHADRPGTPVYPTGRSPGQPDPATGRPPRFALLGHTVRWMVGPTPVTDEQDLLARLQHIYADRDTWQDDADSPGYKKPMPVVLEPHPGTCYDDVARTSDVVHAARFREIHFGGGLGARRADGR